MVENLVFAGGALVCLLGAFGVVRSDNPVHAALSLVGTLLGVAILFIAQDAEFLAAVQVIVYAGAIVVLFLFVIMLIGVDRLDDVRTEPLVGQRVAALVAGGVLVAGLVGVVLLGEVTGERSVAASASSGEPNTQSIGRVLFTDHLLTFEITSVLLVIAVVGAVTLARHRHAAPGDEETIDDHVEAVEEEVAP